MTSTNYAIEHQAASLATVRGSDASAGQAGPLAQATALAAPRTHADAYLAANAARAPAAGLAAPDPLRNAGVEAAPLLERARRSTRLENTSAAGLGDTGKRYVLSLQEQLEQWVDYRAAGAHANSPGALLRAVLAHHGQQTPDSGAVDLARLRDDGWVDEAALLYHQVQDAGARHAVAPPALTLLRARFLDALRSEDARRLAVNRLLARPQDASSTAPYFDGFALRNAAGKRFSDLLQMPDVSGDPAFHALGPEQKRQLLQAKFAAMGESTAYRVGTASHSLASVVIRMSKFMGVPPPTDLGDPEALGRHFQRLEDAWQVRRETFPIHPRLYYSMHLARSNGVEVLSTAQLEERYNAVMQMAVEHAARTSDVDPQTWLHGLPAKWNAQGRRWTNRGDDVKRQALLAAFDSLRAMSARRERPPGVAAERIWSFAAQVGQAGLLGETLVGHGSKEMAAAVLEYGQQRMTAATDQGPRSGLSAAPLSGIRDSAPEESLLGGGHRPRGQQPTAGQAPRIPLRHLPPGQMQGALDAHIITKRLAIRAPEITGHLEIEHFVATPELHVRDGNVPEDLRGLATRVRNGEAGVTWQGHQVALLADEDRVVPLKQAGGKFHEVDWHTGQRVRSGRLVHRDAATGSFRAGSQLHGGGKDLLDSAGTPVQQRVTVTGVHAVLDRATDAGQRDFAAIFNRHFAVRDAGGGMLEWEGAGRTGPQAVQAFVADLYQRSHTFRRILNYYTANARTPNHWNLNFGGSLSNLQPNDAKIFWERRAVDLPANVQSLGERRLYMSADPSGMSVTKKEDMLLHQLLGVLTEVGEPRGELTWSQARTHPGIATDRGALAYLTDKIMSEAGYTAQERVSADSFPGGSAHPRWKDAVHDTQAENRYLDQVVDRGRPAVSAETLVQGSRVADRLTVRQWLGIERRLAGHGVAASARPDAGRALEARFDFHAGAEGNSQAMKNLKRISLRLAEKSETFRTLLAQMPPRQAGKWHFEFNPGAAAELPLDPGRLPVERQVSGGANALNGKIYLFDDRTSYLSEEGLQPVEYERRVVQGFVNAMLDLPMPANELSSNRGAAVRLADMILEESGYRLPRQLVAYRAPESPALQANLASHATAARRAMSVEDAFLEPPM